MIAPFVSLIYLAIIVLFIISWWKLFEKMGRQGWEGIIPIYNMVILLEMVGKPWWWILLMFIPVVNLVMTILTYIALSNRFGQSGAFAIGLTFLGFIFFPILAFGDAQFQPDNNQNTNYTPQA